MEKEAQGRLIRIFNLIFFSVIFSILWFLLGSEWRGEVVATSEMKPHEEAKVGAVLGRERGRKLFV